MLGDYYAVVRGEALAMRAYIHFDLLRLFAPYDFSSEAKPAIPYVKEARPAIAPQLTPAKFVEYALEDVNAAIALLKEDPILTGKDITGMDNGIWQTREFPFELLCGSRIESKNLFVCREYKGCL